MAVPIPVERKENNQGGSYEASIRFTRLGGLKRIRLQIADSRSLSSGQDARMGFHICSVGYMFGIPIILFWEAPPNDQVPFYHQRDVYQPNAQFLHV